MRVVAKSFEKDLDQIILKDEKLALLCDGKELKLQCQNVFVCLFKLQQRLQLWIMISIYIEGWFVKYYEITSIV